MFGASRIRQQVNILADRRQRVHHLAGPNAAAASDAEDSPSVTRAAPRAQKRSAMKEEGRAEVWRRQQRQQQQRTRGSMEDSGGRRAEVGKTAQRMWPRPENYPPARSADAGRPRRLFFKMSAVISSTITETLQQGARCLRRRGPRAARPHLLI